ncbi:MAG: hypothetical protein ACLTC3_03565 [Evtepia gabavorous]
MTASSRHSRGRFQGLVLSCACRAASLDKADFFITTTTFLSQC